MNRWYHILVIVAALFSYTGAMAQEDVVVHADPRLGQILKRTQAKAHEKERMIAKAVVDKEKIKEIPATGNIPSATSATPGGAATANTPVAKTEEAKPAPVRLPHSLQPPDGKVIYSGKGYRVQIYNGPDRAKAIDIKTEFMRHYPTVRTYLTYMSPDFRVKVGNYRNRSDAEGMLREAKSMYTPCLIVPDIITINTF